jgi:hypothetical protein
MTYFVEIVSYKTARVVRRISCGDSERKAERVVSGQPPTKDTE